MPNLMLDHDNAPGPTAYTCPLLLARPAEPRRPLRPVRPALLAGEEPDAFDQHIFRGTD
ncbi:hypothetical protein ABZ892_28045 [Streptomyces sp. NPDC046924]|uniref:hypothetical protein n=1 Tax=Streptomyces sp. NPDC046924 TaxID=3155136 RepID=UPI0033D31596